MSAATLLALFVSPGCLLGPDFEVPQVQVPEKFRSDSPAGESIANLPWWKLFLDEQLQAHVRTALQNNQDIEIALERIAEARASLGFVRADQFPSLGYSGEARRMELGGQPFFSGTPPRNNFSVGVDAFFEVDLWGKLRRATEAARAELLATEASYVSVTISLVSDVASTYFLLLDLDRQLEISKRTLAARESATKIISDRFREGVVAKLDVHQAEIEEATARVGVATVERSVAQAEHAMRILMGRTPGPVPRSANPEGQKPRDVPAGLPSELLQRRPDIQIARHVAAAQTARIGVAEALRFPSLSLTGALGFSNTDVEDLLSANSRFWSLGAAASGPLFQFGKNVRRVDVETARARQSVLDYEKQVLQAFREVEDALVAVRTYRMEYDARTDQVVAAKAAARLARALYDEQFTSYLEVLQTERSLFNAELEQSATLRLHLQAIVQVYTALGGGWSPKPAPDGSQTPPERRDDG